MAKTPKESPVIKDWKLSLPYIAKKFVDNLSDDDIVNGIGGYVMLNGGPKETVEREEI